MFATTTVMVVWLGMNKTSYVASLSGGKDSLFMVDEIIERGLPLTHVVVYYTGVEFESVKNAIEMVRPKVEAYDAQMAIIECNDWFDTMLIKPVHNSFDNGIHYGYEWCGGNCRWGTTKKIMAINAYLSTLGNYKQYIGIAADEPQRIKDEKDKLYPLYDWGLKEADCLKECFSRGYHWHEKTSRTESGYIELYSILDRVSCYCCANKNLKELRAIYDFLPNYWERLKGLQSRINRPFKQSMCMSIFDIENRFIVEDLRKSMYIPLVSIDSGKA